jgi:hypothetical protein
LVLKRLGKNSVFVRYCQYLWAVLGGPLEINVPEVGAKFLLSKSKSGTKKTP